MGGYLSSIIADYFLKVHLSVEDRKNNFKQLQ